MLKKKAIMVHIEDYLNRRTTKPIMTIRYSDTHISGCIYGINTPEVTHYKYTISEKWGDRYFSREVQPERWEKKEIVESLKKKGWSWSIMHPYNGYEIDVLEKVEPFKELPKGENLVGVTWSRILKGRSEIEDYLKLNFRGFQPINIYRVPKSVQL